MASKSTNSPKEALNPLRPWFDYRRKRFWALFAVLAYTLLGFFAVPRLIESVAGSTFADTGRTLRMGEVRVNPWLLTVELRGVELEDRDGIVILAFDDWFINFQASSLFRWAWTFAEIRMAGLAVFEERFEEFDTRYARLIESLRPPSADNEPPATSGSSALPRVIIQRLDVSGARLKVRDGVAGDFEGEFGPIAVEVFDLQTLPDESGEHSITIRAPDGGIIAWRGEFQLVPFASSGTFEIDDWTMAAIYRYIDHFLPFRLEQTSLRVDLRYEAGLSNGELNVAVDQFGAVLQGLRLLPDDAADVVVSSDEITLSGGSLRWPERTVSAESLSIGGLSVEMAREPDGSLSLMRLLPEMATAASDASPERAASPWTTTLDTFRMTDGALHVEDRTLSRAMELTLQELQVELTGIDNRDGTAMPAKLSMALSTGGALSFDGEVSALPALRVNGQVRMAAVELPMVQPYVEGVARVDIGAGSLDVDAVVEHGPDQLLALAGSLGVRGLNVTSGGQDERLLGWTTLQLDRFELDLAANRIETSELEFEQIYGRLHIAADRTTNLTDLLIEAGAETTGGASAGADLPAITVGGVQLVDAALDFSDLSLPLPFAAEIRDLEGEISTLSSTSAEPARLNLEGRVNEYGSARIQGEINAWSPTDLAHVDVVFRNLELSRLTPYTVQFAGYAIEDGRMDLDLGYRLDQRKMQGENAIVIRDIKLGEKIEHPDGGSLPLGLAVALLTDAQGVIDLEVPVEGDLDDPEFHIGGLVMRALGNLITKAVTAPFRLLAGLVGFESEDFGTLNFAPGAAEISPPDREQLVKLGEAMLLRPELAIEVNGVFAPGPDRAALAAMAVEAQIEARQAALAPSADELSTDLERRAVESLFQEAIPEVTLESVQARNRIPSPEGEQAAADALDEPAYVADLRRQLMERQEIADTALAELAAQRAAAVTAALEESQPETELNISPGDALEVKASDHGDIPLELAVTVQEAGAEQD